MKKVLIGVVIVIVIIAGGVYWFASNIDSLIKTAVEKYGSEVTKTEVTLNKVEISLSSGAGKLSGLKMGNPAGFKSDSAFTLGEISVSLDTASLGGDTVVIKEIVIGAPDVTYEIGSNGSNIDAIRKNVDSYVGGSGGSSGGDKAEGDGTKLIIENLYIRDGKVNVSASALGGKKLGAPLPTIHLKDIGKDSGGATPAEVTEKIIKSITDAATKAVGTLDLDKLLGGATGAAKDAMEKGKGMMEKGKEGVGGTIKNLFGK